MSDGKLASQAQTLDCAIWRLNSDDWRPSSSSPSRRSDAELADLALAQASSHSSPSYEGLENGAEYLEHHPQGLYAETVSFRLDNNADTMYREMVLYQQLGDSAKAIARANMILEYAPLSSAARRLGQELESQGISAE